VKKPVSKFAFKWVNLYRYNQDTFVAHNLPEMPPHRNRPAGGAGPSPLKFEATTTSASAFVAHHVRPSAPSPGRSPYNPSSCRFDATTTMRDAFQGHAARRRAPIGVAVADDGFLVMVHAGAEVPTRAAKVFTTTEHRQHTIVVRILR
jgi:hypothetical protein